MTQRKKTTNQEGNQSASKGTGDSGEKGFSSDYMATQYRTIRTQDGSGTRRELIGAAWNTANGAICVRLSGAQIVSNDIYLFPESSIAPEKG